MGTWLARRLLAATAIVFAVVTLTFFLMHLGPASPIVPSTEQPLDPDVVARLRQQFGTDQALPVQYVRYLAQLGRGNFGVSFSQRRPVTAALADAIPNTIVLAGTALVVDFGLGLLLGVVMAARARRPGSRLRSTPSSSMCRSLAAARKATPPAAVPARTWARARSPPGASTELTA